MKKKRLSQAGLAAALLSIVIGGASVIMTGNKSEGTLIRTDYQAKAERRAYTVLLYMNGSDLESAGQAATENLSAMANILGAMGSAANNLHLVVETGGTEIWYTEGLAQNTRFTLTADGVSEPEEISPRSMGHPDSLADFISYGMRSYPSDSIILLFWNHGGGAVYGFGNDELFGGDNLTLPEIRQALSHNAVKGFQCEMIGFDACLMATAETASLLSPWGRYLTASQELEPVEGWDYGWLACLSDPGLDGLTIGREIAERYVAAAGTSARTLSVIDMLQVSALERCIAASFTDLDSEPEYAAVSDARLSVTGFGGPERGMVSDIVDLWSLAQVLAKAVDIPGLDPLSRAIQSAVPVNLHNDTAPPGCGLTVYLPSGSDARLSKNVALYQQNGFAEGYQTFVLKYAEYLIHQSGYDASQVPVCREGSLITARFDDVSQVAGVYLTLFFPVRDGWYAFLGTDSDVTVYPNGGVSASVDWLWISLNEQPLCSIERSMTPERLDCMSPVLLNEEPAWLSLYFDRFHPYGAIAGVQLMDDSPMSAPLRELGINDSVTPLYPLEDFSEQLPSLSGPDIYDGKYLRGEAVTVLNQNGFMTERLEVGWDSLLCGFMVVDKAQQQSYTEFETLGYASLDAAA